jgi:hypothetical protein
MSSRTRSRTRYGYEDKQHVAAASTGVVVEVDYPTNSVHNKPENFPNMSTTANSGTTKLFSERFLLQDRLPLVGSSPGAQSVATTRMSSYYTDYAYNIATRLSSTATASKNGGVAQSQVIYKDLTGTQMGEDDDRSQLLEFDGTSQWTFEVSFRGKYDPTKAVQDTIKRDASFPHIYLTFVTPDDNMNYGLGTFLIIFSVFGCLCLCYVSQDKDAGDFGDDDLCIPCCCFGGCSSGSSSSSSSSGNGARVVSRGMGGVHSSYSAPKAAQNDGVTMVNDTFFDQAVRSARNSLTRGLGRQVLNKGNDDYSTIPVGKYYTAIILPSNDVSRLSTNMQDQYIQHINVHSNDVSNLNGLPQYQALETLIATDNNLKTINFSGASNNLKVLDVGSNDIHKLFPGTAQGMYTPGYNTNYPNLALLVCPNNDVNEISGLASNCPRLQMIDFRNNSLGTVSNVSVFDELAHLPYLTHANVSNNDIKPVGDDLMRFAQTCSPNLIHLNLMENDIPKSKLRQMRDIMQRRGLNTTVLADDGGANIPTATVVIGTANPMH